MGIWSDLTNRLSGNGSHPPETKAIPQLSGGSASDFGLVWLGRGRSTVPDELTRATAYALSVYVYAAMHYRAQKLAEPPVYVAEETEDGEEWIRDHPFVGILEAPNPDMDMGTLLAQTSFLMDMDGEALWVKGLDGAQVPRSLYPFARDEYEVIYGRDRLYTRFDVTHAGGMTSFAPEEVIYFREPAPRLTNRVTSRVDAALKWAQLGNDVELQLKEAMRSGILPPVIMSYPAEYNPDAETREANEEKLQAKFGGARNAGKHLALYGGLQAQFADQDLNKLLPNEIMDRVEANVALAMGVRPEVLGYLVGLKNSPWSHMETARKITYEDGIEPVWRRQEKTLTRQLLPQSDQDARRFVRFDTSGVRALQEDEKRRAEIAKSNSDIWTVGERRIYTGKDPFGDERDDEITSTPAPVAPMQQLSANPAWETKDAGTRNIRWLQFDLDAKAQEPGWEREVLSLLSVQAKGIRAAFERYVLAVGGEPTPESLASFLGAVSEYLSAEGKAEAARILTPLVQSTAERSARRVTARLGWSFDVVQEGLAKYIAEEVDFLVSVMGESTGRAVAETVQSALVDRVPLTELRSRLETLPAFDRKRAQLVARTETTRATNGAQRRSVEEGARELGVVTQKTWLSSRDDRVRDEHDMRDDGEWYSMDHTWGGLKEPGEPNCRCTLDYRVVPSEPQPTGATL